MRFEHTERDGFLIGFLDFFSLGIYLLIAMPRGLQREFDAILGRRTMRYWAVYLLGIPTLFLFTLIWMARIAEEFRKKALALGVEGPHTSFWHMFLWNTVGLFFLGPMISTRRFFDTLNRLEKELNRRNAQ